MVAELLSLFLEVKMAFAVVFVVGMYALVGYQMTFLKMMVELIMLKLMVGYNVPVVILGIYLVYLIYCFFVCC